MNNYLNLKANENNDIYLNDKGDFVLVSGSESVAQTIKSTLNTFLGEFFLDTSFGVPYIDLISGKIILNAFDTAIKNVILNVKGANKISSFNTEYKESSKTYEITANVVVDKGETVSINKTFRV